MDYFQAQEYTNAARLNEDKNNAKRGETEKKPVKTEKEENSGSTSGNLRADKLADKAMNKMLGANPVAGTAVKVAELAGVDVIGIFKKLLWYVGLPVIFLLTAVIIASGYFLTLGLLDLLQLWWIS
jgi:hypothetical protein